MAFLPEDEKLTIFNDRLFQLWKNGYLSDEAYEDAIKANESYIHDMELAANQPEEAESDPVQMTEPEPVKPVKQKKVKSAEEIRERNITWSLILGVSLLLITGLIVATSQWNQMEAGMKVASIAFVSLFFFGLSYFTGHILKIRKTAFAFLTLGSLLIPIGIVAIGFFELLGSYLSLFGEGRYLLGVMGTLLPLPLYIRHAFVHQSRLYVWITLVFASLSVGFALGALPLSVDEFYLLLMLYNAVLLIVYVRAKTWNLFIKELPLYAQLNLVLSTLLMLFFFESEFFYSFNLLLTASIYMAMVFVYKTKAYQFVFSVMIVYAIYQLVEHTPLQSVDVTIYALAGLLYLGFAYAFKDNEFVEKVFRYTSGVVSLCAFIYISYQGITLKGEEGSVVLLVAYLIITANYLLLANVISHVAFRYLTPIFFFISLWNLWELGHVAPLFLFMFLGASIVFVYVGLWTKISWLQPVQESTLYTSLIVLAGSIGYAMYDMLFGYVSFMFLLVSLLAYLVKKKPVRTEIRETAIWSQPSASMVAAAMVYEPLVRWFPSYETGLSFPFHIAAASVLHVIVFVGWYKWKEKELAAATFYISQGAYVLSMIMLWNNPLVDAAVVRPLILLTGIGMMFGLVHFSKQSYLWGAVALVTLAFYVSLLETFSIGSFEAFLIYMLFAPVLLVAIGEAGQKRWASSKPYFYGLGHIIQPLIIVLFLLDQIGRTSVHPLFLLLPLGLYIYSSLQAKREWELKLMLFAALTTQFLVVLTLPDYYGWWSTMPYVYAFLITSILMAGIWMLVSETWKERIEWYWIPFSIFGLFLFTSRSETWAGFEWLVALGYAILILFYLHRRGWSLVRFAPLLLTIVLWENVIIDWDLTGIVAVIAGCIGILLIAGRFFHSYLIGPNYEVDAYSWTALVYIAYLNVMTMSDENVWIRIIPVLLLAVWFLLLAKKWTEVLLEKGFVTAGFLSLYASYLLVSVDYHWWIPDLVEAELHMLPILGILYFLRKRTWKTFATMMNRIQFAVVLFVAAYLVVDAIQSHTIWDAWIIGGLSLASMIAGMQWRIKSYFFVGMGVLMFNVIYQTKPYWGNAPWWVYLLVAGLLLIVIASYNEWKKQQSDSQVERKLKRLWVALKKWN
ncbi:SCO7613 C-terminal domain-containing membrane protein [Halobacillus sp. MO56]